MRLVLAAALTLVSATAAIVAARRSEQANRAVQVEAGGRLLVPDFSGQLFSEAVVLPS